MITVEITYPGGRSIIREGFRRKGYPEESLDITMASISQSTLKQHGSCLRQWWSLCMQQRWDIYTASPSHLLHFLKLLYDKGGTYGTVNCARSAISLIMTLDTNCCLQFKRFFKGLHNLRPSHPRYCSTWNPSVVLTHLRSFYPNDTLNLQKLSFKLVTLLAPITAHRVRTLSLIRVQNIFIKESGYEILITDNIKTSRFSHSRPVLSVPFFHTDDALCVAKTLQTYQKLFPLGVTVSNFLLLFVALINLLRARH